MWLISIGLLSTDLGSSLIFGRTVFAIALGMAYFLCLFVISFSSDDNLEKNRTIKGVLLIGFIVNLILIFSPLVIFSLKPNITQFELPLPSFNYGIYLYAFYLVFALILIIKTLITTSKKSDNNKIRKQAKYIGVALMLFAIFSIMGNLALPLITGDVKTAQYAPFAVLLMNTIITYTVIRHKFLDIKPVIVRSLAYIISLISIATIYVLLLLIIGRILLDLNLSSVQITLLGLVGLFIAFSFQYIKSFFDKIALQFFYDDIYNPQEIINAINNILVNTQDIEKILTDSAKLITNQLKISYLDYYIDKHAIINFHTVGQNKAIFVTKDWDDIYSYLEKQKNIKIATANNTVLPKSLSLKMSHINSECIVKMLVSDELVGYVVVGPKLNGSSYTAQDYKLFKILSDSVAIAVQNALRLKEIEQFANTLQEKINDATTELQITNEKLRSLDEAKDEFISMASHQLRTPLTSIKGYISMMLDGDVGTMTKQQKDFLNQAFMSSQKMVYLISDLLNVSRLKTGKFFIDRSDVYLPRLINDELAQLKIAAKDREINLRFKKPDEFPVLKLDETKTMQVIMNFIDNAIYYSKKGDDIIIELKTDDNYAIFTVSDTGIGVPKKEQHNLFTKFYRAENAKKARPDGTGLGLFMAKKVIVAQGGTLIFKSIEGKGSTFGFKFPV
jgi:signal transduction histidine kinase